jgi:hypothetical protein
VDAIEPALQSDPGGNLSILERLSKAIQESGPSLDEADRLLKAASADGAKINPEAIPERFRAYFQKLEPYLPALQYAIPALKQIPALVGKDQRQDYLILAQNRDELRASGGFITGIGTVSLENAKLTGMHIGDSYAIDDFTKPYPIPPAPLKTFMKADYWVARDGNWSPDFPTAAAQVQKLYTLSTGINTRGVIAFDQLAVKGLLQALGPVQIESYPDSITAATVEDFMHQAWAPDPKEGITAKWWGNRKNFMGELGKALVSRLMETSDPKKMSAVAIQLADIIQQGHLLVYIDQVEIQSALKAVKLDGSIDSGPGDFLYLVDSNIGFNKVDPVVRRELTYEVDLAKLKQPQGKVSIRYQHTIQQPVPCKHEPTYGKGTYADMQARCYWDYWRIYRPLNSTLSDSSVHPVAGSLLLTGEDWTGQVDISTGEGQTTVFGGVMVLATNTTGGYTLTNALPQSVITQNQHGTWNYFLRIPKQPGLEALQVTISVQLPAGMILSNPPADWKRDDSGKWTWKSTLTSLQEFNLTFGKP